ncbi:putative acetyltransferase [Hypoxylon sp. FL1284]|nr:putative acetyltransferase [Hypoxylon sp. FL1284]
MAATSTTSPPYGNLQFRVATPDDAVPIQALVQSAYRGESSRQGWTTEADILTDNRIGVDDLIAKIAAPDLEILFITDSAGALVACCELSRRDDLAHLGLFAVDPRRQNGGVGRYVLAYAEDYCHRAWAARAMEIGVTWTRAELLEWYKRRGFRRSGQTKPFPYEDMASHEALRDDLYFVIMEKDLATA